MYSATGLEDGPMTQPISTVHKWMMNEFINGLDSPAFGGTSNWPLLSGKGSIKGPTSTSWHQHKVVSVTMFVLITAGEGTPSDAALAQYYDHKLLTLVLENMEENRLCNVCHVQLHAYPYSCIQGVAAASLTQSRSFSCETWVNWR